MTPAAVPPVGANETPREMPRETPPARAIVAGHGALATGLVSAVDQITGRGDRFLPLTNAGLALDDIQRALGRALDTTGARVIFTDLPAGSCTMAARRLLRERPGILLVTGVNLAALLDFALQDAVEPAAAAPAALERGRQSMSVYGV